MHPGTTGRRLRVVAAAHRRHSAVVLRAEAACFSIVLPANPRRSAHRKHTNRGNKTFTHLSTRCIQLLSKVLTKQGYKCCIKAQRGNERKRLGQIRGHMVTSFRHQCRRGRTDQHGGITGLPPSMPLIRVRYRLVITQIDRGVHHHLLNRALYTYHDG